MPLADHLATGTQEAFRRTGTDMDSTAGLQDMQFFDRFEHDIGHLTHPIAAIGFHSADIQVRKVIVCTTFLCCDAHFWRGRVVFTLMKKHDISSLASLRVSVPSAIPFS